MRFYIVDDDPAVRSMLEQIIEDEDLGTIAGKPKTVRKSISLYLP